MLALALCLVAAASAMRSIVLAGQTMCYTHGPDFKLSCFGANGTLLGQRYDSTDTLGNVEAKDAVVALDVGGPVAQLVGGSTHYCALLKDRVTVRCWGKNDYGQLGVESAGDVALADATPVDLGGRVVLDIHSGPYHVCAVVDGGAVICWGNNARGQLGYGVGNNTIHIVPNCTHTTSTSTTSTTTTETSTTAPAPTSESPIVIHDQRKRQQCQSVRRVFTPTNRLLEFASRETLAVRVYCGDSHTCILSDDLRVFCWGSNIEAQLGRPNVLRSVPDAKLATAISFSLGAIRVSVTRDSTCALLVSNAVECVGSNLNGALGTNPNKQILMEAGGRLTPENLQRVIVQEVQNSFEQKQLPDQGAPVRVILPESLTQSVGSSVRCSTVAMRTSEIIGTSLVCWGFNVALQFNTGLDADSTVFVMPLAQASTTRIAQIAVAHGQFVVAFDDGTVDVFGDITMLTGAQRHLSSADATPFALPVQPADVAFALQHAPACPNATLFGEDCTCTSVPSAGVLCMAGRLQLGAPLAPSQQLNLTGETHVAHGQDLLGIVNIVATAKPADDLQLMLDGGKCHNLSRATLHVRVPTARATDGATLIAALGCVSGVPSVVVDVDGPVTAHCVTGTAEAVKMQLLVRFAHGACPEPPTEFDQTLVIIVAAAIVAALIIIGIVIAAVTLRRRAVVAAAPRYAPQHSIGAAPSPGSTFESAREADSARTPAGDSSRTMYDEHTPGADAPTPGELNYAAFVMPQEGGSRNYVVGQVDTTPSRNYLVGDVDTLETPGNL